MKDELEDFGDSSPGYVSFGQLIARCGIFHTSVDLLNRRTVIKQVTRSIFKVLAMSTIYTISTASTVFPSTIENNDGLTLHMDYDIFSEL